MSKLGAFCASPLGGFIESPLGARGCEEGVVVVAVVTSDNNLHLFDGMTGSPIWSKSVGAPPVGTPVVCLLPNGDPVVHGLARYSLSTQALIWNSSDNAGQHISTDGSYIYCLQRKYDLDGNELWGLSPFLQATSADYDSGGNVYLWDGTNSRSILKRDASGSLVWSKSLAYGFPSTPRAAACTISGVQVYPEREETPFPTGAPRHTYYVSIYDSDGDLIVRHTLASERTSTVRSATLPKATEDKSSVVTGLRVSVSDHESTLYRLGAAMTLEGGFVAPYVVSRVATSRAGRYFAIGTRQVPNLESALICIDSLLPTANILWEQPLASVPMDVDVRTL